MHQQAARHASNGPGGGPAMALAAVLAATVSGRAVAQESGGDAEDPAAVVTPSDDDLDELIEDIAGLDFEELLQIQVTSVAGRAQALLDTPAAIFVITDEDIRRTGHRSIPEALRMVPGISVGQVSPSIWAIGSRGFQDRFSTDLLVLIDGRTVYDPLFSGVLWNVQDVLLEDLDRIEVIRGPGATLWGSNAVNGVINITTKSARDTQGLFVQGGGGTLDQGFGALRYGDAVSNDTWFRVWAKYDNHARFDDITGSSSHTGWDMFHGGFRIDSEGADDTVMTLQGDIYSTGYSGMDVRVPVPDAHLSFASVALDEEFNGGNILFRAGRSTSDREGWSFQTYYDRTKTRAGQPGWEVRRDTIDVDYRQYMPLGKNEEHVVMWGVGYRHSDDRTDISPTLAFMPRTRSADTFTGFIQDTIDIVDDEVVLMLGSKFEHNDYTGFEFQPSARLSWTPDDERTIWAAVSRPVRVPSRIADDTILTTAIVDTGLAGGGPPSGMFAPLQLLGDSSIDSEELLSFELGYRFKFNGDMTFDIATYYNDYDDLITFPLPAGTFGNRGSANTYGVEVASTWQAAENLQISASYTFFKMDFDSVDGTTQDNETPQQQVNVRSFLDLTDDLEFNAALYWVDNVPAQDIDSYFRLDLGLTWRPSPGVEFAVWGQNLLDQRHVEYVDDLFQAVPLEVERSVYAQVSLTF